MTAKKSMPFDGQVNKRRRLIAPGAPRTEQPMIMELNGPCPHAPKADGEIEEAPEAKAASTGMPSDAGTGSPQCGADYDPWRTAWPKVGVQRVSDELHWQLLGITMAPPPKTTEAVRPKVAIAKEVHGKVVDAPIPPWRDLRHRLACPRPAPPPPPPPRPCPPPPAPPSGGLQHVSRPPAPKRVNFGKRSSTGTLCSWCHERYRESHVCDKCGACCADRRCTHHWDFPQRCQTRLIWCRNPHPRDDACLFCGTHCTKPACKPHSVAAKKGHNRTPGLGASVRCQHPRCVNSPSDLYRFNHL